MPALERRFLPGLNTEISAIGAGCWTIGGTATNNGVPIGWDNVNTDAAYAGLVRAHQLGVTLYDTADVYGLGRSERLLGNLLTTINRTSVVISSKVGYFAGTGNHPYHPSQIHHQLSTTLDNLGTDYLDIYFLHSSDFGELDQYLPETTNLLHRLRDQGIIGSIGMRAPHTFAEQWASGYGPAAVEAARFLYLFHTIAPDVVAARYNLLSPLYSEHETDIFTFARQHHVGVLIKQALGQGRLLDRHAPEPPPTFSAGDHRSADPQFTAHGLTQLNRRLAPLKAIFGKQPAQLARIALRYALQQAPEAAVLVGFRDAEQIHSNVTCLDKPLSQDEITQIQTVLHYPNTPR